MQLVTSWGGRGCVAGSLDQSSSSCAPASVPRGQRFCLLPGLSLLSWAPRFSVWLLSRGQAGVVGFSVKELEGRALREAGRAQGADERGHRPASSATSIRCAQSRRSLASRCKLTESKPAPRRPGMPSAGISAAVSTPPAVAALPPATLSTFLILPCDPLSTSLRDGDYRRPHRPDE